MGDFTRLADLLLTNDLDTALRLLDRQVSSGGGGGFLGLGIWRYRTSTTSTPSSGQLQFDNTTIGSATELYVHSVNDSGADMSAFLDLLTSFDLIYIQVQVDASQFVTLQIGVPSLASSVYTFPILQIQGQGATPSNNTQVAVVIERSGVGSGVTDHGALSGLADDDHPQYIQGVAVSNEGGVPLTTLANALDFVGTGVDASGTGVEKTITFDYLDPDVTDNLTVGYTTDIEADTLNAGIPKTLDPVCTLEYFKTLTVDDDFTLNVPSGGNGHCEYYITVDSSGPYTLTPGSNVSMLDGNVTLLADDNYILNIHRYSATNAVAQLISAEGSTATRGITIEDEGTPLATLATTIDFVGNNVVASGTLTDKTVTIGRKSITVTSSPYTASTVSLILVDDDTAGATTVNLPAAASSLDKIYTVVKMGSTATVTLDGNSSETINGALTHPLNSQYDSVEVHCNGTEWVII